MPFDAVLMDMQMPDIDGLEATRRIRADGRFAGLPIRHDRQRLAGRPRSRLAAGMNDHVAKPIDKERLVLCLLGHLGRSGARGAPATAADAGELVEARGDIVGRFGGSLELIVQVLRRFVPDMQGPLRPARTPARRGRCPGQRRDPAYHQGQRFHRWRQRPAGRASELEQALRRADQAARHGNPRRHPPRRTAHSCAMPVCSACRRCSATCRRSRRAEPRRGGQSRQGFRRTRGSPASAAACRANNAMGVIRRYS